MASAAAQLLASPLLADWPITQGYGTSGWPGHPGAADAEPAGHGQTHWHAGLDYGCPAGTALHACADGTVVYAGLDPYGAGYNGGFGLMLQIRYDPLGPQNAVFYSLFGHESALLVTTGQHVTRGQHVSDSGGDGPPGVGTDSGNSSGAHLHYEIRTGNGGFGSDINPTQATTTFVPPQAPVAPDPPGGQGSSSPPASGQGGSAPTQALEPSLSLADLVTRDRKAAIPLAAVRPFAATLQTPAGKAATAWLWLQTTRGPLFLPTQGMDVTLATFNTPGKWSALLSLEWLYRAGLSWLPADLKARTETQVICSMGYADSVAALAHVQSTDLTPMFTGLQQSGFSAHGSSRTLELAGPDLSGLLSKPSATAPDLAGLTGLSPVAIAQALARAHNLGYSTPEPAPSQVGALYSTDTISQQQQGQTEWTVLTKLANDQGWCCYMDGTTLVFGPVPPTGTPVPLHYFAAGGAHDPLIDDASVTAQKHAKGDYQIVVQSYDPEQKQARKGTLQTVGGVQTNDPVVLASAGNAGSTLQVTITVPPGMSGSALQAKAQHILEQYQRTEVLLTADLAGAIALHRDQPLDLHSAVLPDLNDGKPYYPSTLQYTYGAQKGIAMHIVATSRPFAVTTTVSGGASLTGF